jgi:coenzyme F420-dependent glucose-6-phosphate dehydrogenase
MADGITGGRGERHGQGKAMVEEGLRTMAAIRFGYKASAEQFGPRELLGYAVEAERVGLDSVTVSDHFQPWQHEGGHAPFSLSWLAAVGERTERIMLGTSVMTPTFRYNPAVIAQAFGTLGCLYPGRVMLGIGTGEALNEVAVSRIQWPEFKERFARLREAVELIRALWAGERVSFDGDYYQTTDATVYDRPARPDLHCGRWLSGRGPMPDVWATDLSALPERELSFMPTSCCRQWPTAWRRSDGPTTRSTR